MKTGYITINVPWISSNFLFACSSGIFTSLLVVLTGEILELAEEQKNTEHVIFNQLVYLYGQLHVAENNIRHALSNDELVAENMLDYLKETISSVSSSLRAIDYNPFFQGKNTRSIKGMMLEIVSTHLFEMGTLQSDCIYLPIAVNYDRLEERKMVNFSPKITSHSPNTNKTLVCLLEEIKQGISIINGDIETLDNACKGRFNWNVIRNNITTITYPDTSLEKFWSKFNKQSANPA